MLLRKIYFVFKIKIPKILILGFALIILNFNTQSHDGHKKDIIDTAIYGGIFKTFISVIKAADLVDTLKRSGQFTVFAPTDEAFLKLPKGTIEFLMKPENKKLLKDFLKYHIIKARVTVKKISSGTAKLKMLNKKEATLISKDGKVTINKVKILKSDVMAKNGIIHIINGVLQLPKEK